MHSTFLCSQPIDNFFSFTLSWSTGVHKITLHVSTSLQNSQKARGWYLRSRGNFTILRAVDSWTTISRKNARIRSDTNYRRGASAIYNLFIISTLLYYIIIIINQRWLNEKNFWNDIVLQLLLLVSKWFLNFGRIRKKLN